jgi:electron transfer flavoprotein beta subunit
VNEIQTKGNHLVLKRISDGFLDTLEVALPALLIVTQELCPVRDLPLGSLEMAFSEKDIIRWGIEDLDLKKEEVGIEGSATQVVKLGSPLPDREGEVVSGPPQSLVDNLIHKLEALGVLGEQNGKE